ncbi:MAG: L-aspartate oxidase [Clostridiales bacterium]|nr:L-aspartate oxidase [Clostridiales bacterium]
MERRFLPEFKNAKLDVFHYDAVVVGAGIAGLYAALHISPEYKVAVIAKAHIEDSNSYLAQGGIAAVTTRDDTYIAHIEDTLKAGAGLCDRKAVEVLVEEGPSDIEQLIKMAVPFDINADGDLLITREGGHTRRRILHCGGDATGRETTKQLGMIALQRENLDFHFNTYLVDILTEDERVFGVLIMKDGVYSVIRSNHIIIATGGIGQCYDYTTNPAGAVGDGIAACHRAGAVIQDMEFVQFHPTTLISEGKTERLFLISEAVRGEGGILRNSKGEAFMKDKHEMADLAPRDIVTREIIKELKRTGDEFAYLDCTSMKKDFFISRFPTIYHECLTRGINIPDDFIPVRPAQHYLMGGVKTDLDGQTNIKGLYCCGECARTGIHGANRLASNSLLECLVFGRRAASHINNNFTPPEGRKNHYKINTPAYTIIIPDEELKSYQRHIKHILQSCAGAERRIPELKYAIDELKGIKQVFDNGVISTPMGFRVYNMLTIGLLITESAYNRRESVGAHYILEE